MANGWFRKRNQQVPDIPEGLWTQCSRCRELLFTREWERNLKVCMKCGHHARLTARERIQLLLDQDSFRETDAELYPVDVLRFPGYEQSLERYRRATGLEDAILSGLGAVEGVAVSLAITDANFMMGSMGSVVGERLSRAVERATAERIPVLLVSGTGGGARMQEGLLSLMQMAKTSAAIARHHAAGLLTVVLLTSPSMAGVLASWGSLGDFLIAEPGAMIGFVGQRVSQQANVSKVPADFQTSEFQLAHGHIDRIVARKDLRTELSLLFRFGGGLAAVSARAAA